LTRTLGKKQIEPLSIVGLSGILSVKKPIGVSVHIFLPDLAIDSKNATLQNAPEVLNILNVNGALDIFLLTKAIMAPQVQP
jgi:hypothetical protein